MDHFIAENGDLVALFLQWSGRLVGAIAILIAGWVAGSWISCRIENLHRLDGTLRSFLGGLLKYTVLIVSVITIIGLFGIPMASLLAVLGAAGLAVGLALQGTLSNVAAGVMLLILRPFNVGDYIDYGQGGTVKTLGLFGTELSTPDNVYVFTPNSEIWGHTIRNYSRNLYRRQDLLIGISYFDDIGKAFKIVAGILENEARIVQGDDQKKAEVMVDTLGDFSVNLIVRFWSLNSDYWALRWDITRAVKEAFDRDGITIPFPTQMELVLGPDGKPVKPLQIEEEKS